MDDFARVAVGDDATALARLEAAARDTLASVDRGGPQWLATHPELGVPGWSVRLADPGWRTVVAGIDDVVLAYGAMRVPLGAPRAVATIEAIHVDPGAREVGLGEAVLTALVEAAQACGADEIEATALPGDRETKNLYERMGLVARLIVVSRRLDRP